MNRVESWLRGVEAAARRPVNERVAELLEAVRRGSRRAEGETWDQASERHAEEFIAWLRAEFPGRVFDAPGPPDSTLSGQPSVLVERQRLRPLARRTTGYNYVFTVPGDSPERLVLVAHYDTWRGPGADDNTTGEEIAKQYLVTDLRAERRPPLTHLYLLAGSEECGLIGFTSQLLLALGLGLANVALTKGLLAFTALGLVVVPLTKFRFGVSGSREYVQGLAAEELALVKSVVSVDSVGEGRMYIPESSLGADFVRAFIPFEGYDALNDVLEEAAHLNGIKYNSFIAGGTTDHVSFLEVGSTLRDHLGDWLGCPRWLGCHRRGTRRIPAAALVALLPGKASPLVFGGKIHTPHDTADRVHPGPLAEVLRILDYWFHVLQGGSRIAEPRDLGEYHYAQLFRVRVERSDAPPVEEHWLALKDAIEPNRRNINGLYRVDAAFEGHGRLVCRRLEAVDWGVETQLAGEVADRLAGAGSFERVPVRELRVETPAGTLEFAARRDTLVAGLPAAAHQAIGSAERLMGESTFPVYFGAAFLLAKAAEGALTWAFFRSSAFSDWFFRYFALTLPLTLAVQLSVVVWLMGTKIPTLIDNSYRHLNRADNLRSLRRVAAKPRSRDGANSSSRTRWPRGRMAARRGPFGVSNRRVVR